MTNLNRTNKIIVIIGPTATNKTKLAISLAKNLNGEIINADAFQVYREVNVGVNKPTHEELQQAKFHLVDCISIVDKWNIKKFQTEANKIIKSIYARECLPIIVGGSHLYIDALINNYDLDNNEERNSQFDNLSVDELLIKLQAYDPKQAQKIGKNHRRLVRTLQIFSQGGQMHKRKNDVYQAMYIFCNKPRVQLQQDINARVDLMLLNGWIQEVKNIIKKFPDFRQYNASKAIGYQEIITHIQNQKSPLDINKIKQRTRQYAKRQLTWIRHHYPNYYEYNQNNFEVILDHIKKFLQKV